MSWLWALVICWTGKVLSSTFLGWLDVWGVGTVLDGLDHFCIWELVYVLAYWNRLIHCVIRHLCPDPTEAVQTNQVLVHEALGETEIQPINWGNWGIESSPKSWAMHCNLASGHTMPLLDRYTDLNALHLQSETYIGRILNGNCHHCIKLFPNRRNKPKSWHATIH